MSVLPPDVHNALGQLLQALSTADNATRTHAEESLNNEWVVARPDVLLMGLVEQMQTTEDLTVHKYKHLSRIESSLLQQTQSRSFAAVLFRRIATKTRKVASTEESKELFIALQDAQKVAIRERLLQCLQSETLPQVRHKVGDAVAEVARQYAENGRFHILTLYRLHLYSIMTSWIITATIAREDQRGGHTRLLFLRGSLSQFFSFQVSFLLPHLAGSFQLDVQKPYQHIMCDGTKSH